MGVPVVSLCGEAFFERLSHSILTNAGLAELSTADLAAYRSAALQLAADPRRLAGLRSNLRGAIKAGPLGDRAGFAAAFYDLASRVAG
jgi:protein O-GlcNAc transferase